MFMGVKAHRQLARVESFADAQAAFDKIATGPKRRVDARGDGDYALTGHSKSVCWIGARDDGAIAFRLYDTDVVTWRPDNSVVIDNYGTATTSEFARRFLPGGICLSHPTTRRGSEGGHRGIRYGTERHPERGYLTGTRLCFGSLVRFEQHGEFWLPDESTLDKIQFVDLDRTAAREVSRTFHLADFEKWLSMAPRHLDLEHDGWDLETCAEALRARDFRTAAEHLPLVEVTDRFGIADRLVPLPIETRNWDRVVTMASFAKLKLALWDGEMAFDPVTVTTMDECEFDRRMARVRQLRAVANSGYNLGPQR